jgi:hypothetical protein
VAGTSEGQTIADAKAEEIAALSWRELDAYGERVDAAAAPSGRTFTVRSRAFWDMEPWASGMNISVKAYATTGFRRIRSFKAWRTRGGADDPVPEAPATKRG